MAGCYNYFLCYTNSYISADTFLKQKPAAFRHGHHWRSALCCSLHPQSLSTDIQSLLWGTHLSPVTPQLQTTAICRFCCCCPVGSTPHRTFPCVYTWIIYLDSPHCFTFTARLCTADHMVCTVTHRGRSLRMAWCTHIFSHVCVTSGLFHHQLPQVEARLDTSRSSYW